MLTFITSILIHKFLLPPSKSTTYVLISLQEHQNKQFMHFCSFGFVYVTLAP